MDIELLDQALAHIDANPEEWNQAKWACGTTACLAGHVLLIGSAAVNSLHDLDGYGGIGAQAADLLDLPRGDSHPLWDSYHTRDSLRVWRDSLAGVPVRAAGMILLHADFEGADLAGADFDGADLSEADFDGANLSGASFRKAILIGTRFALADLTGADFTGIRG